MLYSSHWTLGYVKDTELPKALPKVPKSLGSRLRYHNAATQKLDFRLTHWASLFGKTEVQKCPLDVGRDNASPSRRAG